MTCRPRQLLLAVAVFLAGSLVTHGIVTIVSIDAQSTTGSIAGQAGDANITGVELARGPDLVPDTTFTGFFDSANWSSSSEFPGIASGSYVAFRFEVASGFVFDPTAFSFYYEDDLSGDAPIQMELRYSGDNFAGILFTDANTFNDQVESVGDLVLSPVTGTVEYRFYGFGASASSGILGFTNTSSLDVEGTPVSIRMEGELTPVPEPGWSALMAACAGLLMVVRRRL